MLASELPQKRKRDHSNSTPPPCVTNLRPDEAVFPLLNAPLRGDNEFSAGFRDAVGASINYQYPAKDTPDTI